MQGDCDCAEKKRDNGKLGGSSHGVGLRNFTVASEAQKSGHAATGKMEDKFNWPENSFDPNDGQRYRAPPRRSCRCEAFADERSALPGVTVCTTGRGPIGVVRVS